MKHHDTNLFQTQFFFDDTWIEHSIRLQRVWHQAEKRAEPVLRGERPWEGDLIIGYGSVLHYEGRFRMWYKVWPEFSGTSRCVCYAESEDGIHWTRPFLGLHEYEGSKDNNIIIRPEEGYLDCLGVIDDPEDSAWPLKMIYWIGVPGKPEKTGLTALRSEDGIHWEKSPGLVLPGWGDRTNIMPAKDNGKYVIFGRYRPHMQKYACRVVSRTESEDLVHWSEPELVLKPDCEDEAHMQIYSASAFRWESLYMGFIERMHMAPDVLDPELWFSHDGHHWQRSRGRQAFIERSPFPHFDCGWLNLTCNAPIPSGCEMLLHYSGRAHGHHAHRGLARRYGAIGVATLRIDGFCSLQAKEATGWLVTPPMRWPEAELRVNADPRLDITTHYGCADGEVRVEVRYPGGRPVKGLTFDDCVPQTANTFRDGPGDATRRVEWKSGKRIAELAGRNIRLAFRLRDAHLYTFKAAEPEND